MRPSRAERPQQDWRVLMVLFTAALLLEMTAWGHLLAFTPLYLSDELHLPADQIPVWTGILASSSLIVAVPLSPFWGVLADRYSRKLIIMRSEVVEVLVYGALFFIGDVWQMLAVRLLLGLAFANVAVMIATQSLVTPERRLGFAIGTIQMAMPLAVSLGPFVGSVLINTVGLRGMFAVDAGLALAASLLVFFFVHEPAARKGGGSVHERLATALGEVARKPAIRWNFVAWFLIYWASSGTDPYLPIAIGQLSGTVDAPTAIGLILGAQGLLTALGTPIAGRLADRVGTARLFLVAAAAATVITFALSLASSLEALAALIVLRALPLASMAPALYAHLAAHSPAEHRSALLGLTPMPRNLAMLGGPIASASVVQAGLGAVFWLAAAAYALALPFAIALGRLGRPPGGASANGTIEREG
ncbi:MAG: MFS transporter [Chloroflexota bacterium]